MNWEQLLSLKRVGDVAKRLRIDQDETRLGFDVDFDRIIFSSSFRSLQDKTQVIPVSKTDFVHTRLTHSMEVSVVGRSLGRIVGKQLIEKYPNLKSLGYTFNDFGAIVAAAALSHDIGNPPFGHSGEKAIGEYFISGKGQQYKNQLTEGQWQDLIDFEGNANGFRILTEGSDGAATGLRLSYATLGAFMKYPKESLPKKATAHIVDKKYGFFQAQKSAFIDVADELGLKAMRTGDKTTSTQEDLSACDSSNRDHAAGDSEADSFGVCPTTASQTITVSIDVSADPGGVNIVTPTVSGNWAEYAATVDPNDANKYSYTFAEGVTSAEFVWKVYGTSAGDVQESLTSLVGGGAIENNLAATLPTGNGINTDYSTYCNRTVASDSGDFVAPTFVFNSFKQVGVTYTELVLTADSGDSYAIDYSVNDYSEYHGPGATDNGDGTYTVIVDPSSAFTYLWYNITTSTQEDLSACDSSNRDHAAGDSEADSFGVCPTTASQTITVSIDVSADPGGVNIVTPTVSGNWAEYAATVDPNDANKYSYTFAEGVTSAEFVWKVYGTSAGDVQESLTSLVGGGAIENNLAATLPTGNGINTDYSSYCNRTVASDSGDFVAPTFIFNSFKQVGVTYTELVLTADSGDSYAIDYSVNDYSEYHGPGATDNGDGTYTVIVDPSSAFTYLWYNRTTSTQEDLSACGSSNRNHTAGVSEADTFGVCPASADVKDNNIVNVSVYPNPSNSDWNFRTPNTVINSVEVFNLLGKRVASQRSNNNTEISISTQGLTSGIYIARITTEEGTKSVKLIKN